jgi:hypothetical protein
LLLIITGGAMKRGCCADWKSGSHEKQQWNMERKLFFMLVIRKGREN